MRADYVVCKVKYNGALRWRGRFCWDEGSKKYLVSRELDVPVNADDARNWVKADAAAKAIAAELKSGEQKKQPAPNAPTAVADTPLLDYITAFWSNGSDYLDEQAFVNKVPLSAKYIEYNQMRIRLHIAPCPLFADLTMSGLSRKIIRQYMLWGAREGKSGDLINKCLQTMGVPTRWAVANGDLPADPFFKVGKAYHEEKIPGVLTFEERERLITSPITDYYARLGVLLELLCGMRRGEIRGLRWGDIGDGIITVQHNWVDGDGAKNPKCKGGLVRQNTRYVPLPNAIADILNVVVKMTSNTEPNDFIIQSMRRRGVAVSARYFADAARRELEGIGIPGEWPRWKKEKAPADYVNEQKKRNLTGTHFLRHTFVTHGLLAGATPLEMQAIAGHGPEMQARYSRRANQVLDYRAVGEKLEKPLIAAPVP